MISVIIPTYNRANHIGRAIQSVLSQTYEDWEIIVVDDASTDGTILKVQEFGDDRIRYIRHFRNAGANAARNTGVQMASGNIVAFLDSDDAWLPNFLACNLQTMQKSGAALVYCWGTFLFDDYVYDRCGQYEGRDLYLATLMGTFTPTTSQIMAERDAVVDVGLFDPRLPTHQERELIVRVAERYHTSYTPIILTRCYHQTSWAHISAEGGAMRHASELFYERHKHRLEREGLLVPFLQKSSQGMTFGRNDPGGGRIYAARLIKAAPLALKGYRLWLLSWTPSVLRKHTPRLIRTWRQIRGRETHPLWLASARSALDEATPAKEPSHAA